MRFLIDFAAVGNYHIELVCRVIDRSSILNYLLLELYAPLDQLLGEEHRVLQVDVVVASAVHEIKAIREEVRRPGEYVARLVTIVVAALDIREAHVTLSVHRI